MLSVGIDVSKGKSTVSILKATGEVLCRPFEVRHTEGALSGLAAMLLRLEGEVKVIMEATGIYHLPVLCYLKGKGLFVAVINPLEMKMYRCQGLRKAKTDRIDSLTIARYGLSHWLSLVEWQPEAAVYGELNLLGRQYRHYMEMHVSGLLELTHLLDYTMPGVKRLFNSWSEASGKNKLADFAEEYWHFGRIVGMGREGFIEHYLTWAKKKGYHRSQSKAEQVYALAKEGIPTLGAGPTTQMLVREAAEVLRRVDKTLRTILARMQEIAKALPEYAVVRSMGGVGDVLAPKLIAAIGDVRRFHSGKALIAYAGIDAPPYQSGQFTGTNRKISKRGSALLRKTGYEVMRVLKSHKEPEDNAVYLYILKKEQEGKAKRQAKIAGLNKFLRIYYARVKEVYKDT